MGEFRYLPAAVHRAAREAADDGAAAIRHLRWAAACAERALPVFEQHYPHDTRPRNAVATARQWLDAYPGRGHVDLTDAAWAAEEARGEAADPAARAAAEAAAETTWAVRGFCTAEWAGVYVERAIQAAQAAVAAAESEAGNGQAEQDWQLAQLAEAQGSPLAPLPPPA